MLERVKLSLGIKSNVKDAEILDLIEAAKLDLSISGVYVINDEDPLIIQAVKTYCKANSGIFPNSEKYEASYKLLKEHLALCGDYNVLA